MPKAPSINLARGRGQTFLDRFLNWALSVGRVIVILTEAVALGAFLFRFNLDRQIIDLHSKINQEQIIVKLLSNNESTFRSLQDRISSIEKLSTLASEKTSVIRDIFELVPATMNLEQIQLTADTVTIEASAQTPESLAIFLKTLKNYPHTKSVTIDRIDNKTTTATIIMGITVKLNISKT